MIASVKYKIYRPTQDFSSPLLDYPFLICQRQKRVLLFEAGYSITVKVAYSIKTLRTNNPESSVILRDRLCDQCLTGQIISTQKLMIFLRKSAGFNIYLVFSSVSCTIILVYRLGSEIVSDLFCCSKHNCMYKTNDSIGPKV